MPSATTAHTTSSVLTGMTLGGGALEWLTVHSSLVTAGAVVLTTIGSLVFSYLNKKIAERNAKANEERNKVNKRDITSEITRKLMKSGKSTEYIEDLQISINE